MNKLNESLKKIWNSITLLEGTNWDELKAFLTKEGIEFNSVDWIGSGEYGNAYSLGNGKVFKITTSENEFHVGSGLVGKNYPGLVQYYGYGWYSDKPKKYYLIMEELDVDSSIDDDLSRIEMILTTQGLGLSYEGLTYFDEDEYDGSEGELDPDIQKFMEQLRQIYISCQRIGVAVPDVNYGNLGYDKSGNLTLFDIQDRTAMRNRMW